MGTDRKRKKAKALFCHYFSILFDRAGLSFDSDTEAEIHDAIDRIIEVAAEEGAKIAIRKIADEEQQR